MSADGDEPLEVKVTFIVAGEEVVGVFRAERTPGETRWTAERPWMRHWPTRKWMLGAYAHIGQHTDVDRDLLTECRRATPEEYAPLMAEMQKLGYVVTPHQCGRLTVSK